MRIKEFSETGRKPIKETKPIYEAMMEEADEINRLLDSIDIPTETDIDQKWIRENETKEKTNAVPAQSNTDDKTMEEYESIIRRLALDKLRNDLLFEGKLTDAIKDISLLGLNITREDILSAIEKEIAKQMTMSKKSEPEQPEEEENLDDILDDMNNILGSFKH